jgi:hypothetical protein
MNKLVFSIPIVASMLSEALTTPKNLNSSIRRIFSQPINKKNPLQPSIGQVKKLESMDNINNFLQNLPSKDWCEVVEHYKSYLFDGKAYHKIADQELRAEFIANYIESNPNIKRIVTMDGHGRFIMTLLSKLKNKSLIDDIQIIVVDIDSVVNKWHQLFFPKSVISIEGNIFDYKPDNETFVYMNFCGIGGLNGQKMLLDYLSEIKSNTNNELNMMLSVSTARAAKKSCEWITTNYRAKWLKPYTKTYKGKKISDGPMNNFPTYWLKWPKN